MEPMPRPLPAPKLWTGSTFLQPALGVPRADLRHEAAGLWVMSGYQTTRNRTEGRKP
ncbi:hypothetical protein Mapa_003776 [Marchantia paleacea]|nr:hypothetical protein Mapa_003776 [Marchantia paleacea]